MLGKIVEANEDSLIDKEKLLGELLRWLRNNQEIKTLVVCREINKLDLVDGIVVIDASNEILNELAQNKQSELLYEFFGSRGLCYKLKKLNDNSEDIKKLQKLLGGNLVIK